jgi:uncharacterized protein (TIGR02996 family)
MHYGDHPECRAFLASILDNPDDDTPRLVFADWLDETGDPDAAATAKDIRLEVDRHARGDRSIRWGGSMYDERYGARRGFTEGWRGRWAAWLRDADAIMGTRPISHVEFTDAEWITLRIGTRNAIGVNWRDWCLYINVDIPAVAYEVPTPNPPRARLSDLATMMYSTLHVSERLRLKWQTTEPTRAELVRMIGPMLTRLGRYVLREARKERHPIRTVAGVYPRGLPPGFLDPA